MKDYINIFFMIVMSISCLLVALNNISPYKLTIKDNTIMGVSIFLMYTLLRYTIPDFANIIIYFMPIFFLFRKSKKIFTSIVIEIFVCVIIIITDNLVSTIAFFVFGEDFESQNIEYWITCFAILIVLYIITKIIRKLFNRYRNVIIENLKSKYFIMIYAMVIMTFAIFYFDINWSKYLDPAYIVKISAITGLMYGLIMIIVCLSLLFMIKKEEKFKYEQVELENLKEYTDNLEKLYTEMRKFRHDYINIISSLAAFIEDRDMEGLEEYFNSNICPLNNQMNNNNYKLGLLKNIQLQEVKGLISAKVIRAQELGVDVIIDIVETIDRIDMDKIDLIRSLGIIFDNAIESAINSSIKRVRIGLIKKGSSVIVVVTNTYEGELLPIAKMFKAGVSTKGKDRGLGLSNLRETLDKYENVSLDTYIKDNEFIQEISICNK